MHRPYVREVAVAKVGTEVAALLHFVPHGRLKRECVEFGERICSEEVVHHNDAVRKVSAANGPQRHLRF